MLRRGRAATETGYPETGGEAEMLEAAIIIAVPVIAAVTAVALRDMLFGF
ncbi:hypothetical protein [Sinorhizobium fredii]